MEHREIALCSLCALDGHEDLTILYRLPIVYEDVNHTPCYACFHLVEDVERLDGSNELAYFDAITDSD
jgi:hypothetical protein